MSTSLLYYAFGLRGYAHVQTSYREGTVIFTISQKHRTLWCPSCESREVHRRGGKTRMSQHLPIGGKPVFVELEVPRVHFHRQLRRDPVYRRDGLGRLAFDVPLTLEPVVMRLAFAGQLAITEISQGQII